MTRTNGTFRDRLNSLPNSENDPVILSLDDVVPPPNSKPVTTEEPARQIMPRKEKQVAVTPPPPGDIKQYLQNATNVIETFSQAGDSGLREVAQMLEQCGGECERVITCIIED